MAATKRTKDQALRDRYVVSELYLKGRNLRQITDELNERPDVEYQLSMSSIARDLNLVRDHWLSSMVRDFDQAKAVELAKLDNLEREAWFAWEWSKTEKKTRTIKATGPRHGLQNVEKTEKTEESIGDPRYMQVILQCIEKRVKILGLEVGGTLVQRGPQSDPDEYDQVPVMAQLPASTTAGGMRPGYDFSNLSLEERRRLNELLDKSEAALYEVVEDE